MPLGSRASASKPWPASSCGAAVAARQLPDPVPAPVAQPDGPEQLGDPGPDLAGRLAGQPQREGNVVGHVERGMQVVALEDDAHVAEAPARPLRGRGG